VTTYQYFRYNKKPYVAYFGVDSNWLLFCRCVFVSKLFYMMI
jgi:hypothetical protein